MRGSLRVIAMTIVLGLAATTAVAQLTVATDATQYTQSDIVTITIHNAGPGPGHFISDPAYIIHHLETALCVDACVALAVVWDMLPGEKITASFDLDLFPIPLGMYRVELTGTSTDPGSILSCDFELLDVLAAGSGSWGSVKALYH
ncbi:MAG: hypothetical protein Q7W56_05150 [Candidatus Latescibacteria bacterium]|nr:hypothetical protein [Candidatus Latescibacterota bacterium]